MKTVFVDSSVLFTAINSPTGGSAKLFTIEKIHLITSTFVITEVERNVRKKLHSYHLERFFLLAAKLAITDQLPKNDLLEKAKKTIAEKDAIILAQAKEQKTNFLVTLDKKHFLTESAMLFLKPQKILTPKMLLTALVA